MFVTLKKRSLEERPNDDRTSARAMTTEHDVRITFSCSTDPSLTRTVAFRVDASRKAVEIRARDGADAGWRRYLTLVERSLGARVSRRCDRAAVQIHGVTFERVVAPALATLRDGRETAQRQFGALADGVAAQVRFGRASDEDDACEVLDGAVTIDPLHPSMEACADALGDLFAEGARAMDSRAVRVGKNPEVWTPRKLEKGDSGYVPGKDTYEHPWEPHKFASEFDAYHRIQSEADPFVRKIEAQQRHAMALEMRVVHLAHVKCGLEAGTLGEIAADSLTRRVVDEKLVDELHATLKFRNEHTGEEFYVARDCGVYFDDCEGCDAAQIEGKALETAGEWELSKALLMAMHGELQERWEWDTFESGIETRDVLENGVRRAHMERLLGRPATRADVDASLKLPERVRAKIVGGYDVERSKALGKYIAAAGVERARLQ